MLHMTCGDATVLVKLHRHIMRELAFDLISLVPLLFYIDTGRDLDWFLVRNLHELMTQNETLQGLEVSYSSNLPCPPFIIVKPGHIVPI